MATAEDIFFYDLTFNSFHFQFLFDVASYEIVLNVVFLFIFIVSPLMSSVNT